MSIRVTPASSAACTVATLSSGSASPYGPPDMAIAPRPIAETTGPVLPSRRVRIAFLLHIAAVRAFVPYEIEPARASPPTAAERLSWERRSLVGGHTAGER
ncbi:hypothetical protein Ade02nite_80320 [Paractinoplanes deccanensis]|uniref:Uncharacterized protein n=1 Tax=Paractinoplanes deccanensis TaxID=113561 RepID=A0ABQ3YHB6_9ACTN|nr:hypothetical protein Ade02nite_80320 [Actinoplanes deccanensis]